MEPNRLTVEAGPQCPRCGKGYPAGYRYCGRDGARLVEPDACTLVGGPRSAQLDRSLLIAGRYLRIRALGDGGQARVSLVQDIRTGRMLALKAFRAEVDLSRCRAEIAAAAQIEDHTHIVKVHELDRDPVTRRHFMTMEYLEGETLEERLGRAPLSMGEAVSILLQTAHGLTEMHRRALVHRDVKPANIMVREVVHQGERRVHVKLLDLGIAKSLAPGVRPLTVPGSIVGTLDYAAPEQLRGEAVSPAFDIYALGVVAHQLLAGRLPGEPARAGRPLPEGLRLLLDQMLQTDPAERPARMADVCVALSRAQRWLSRSRQERGRSQRAPRGATATTSRVSRAPRPVLPAPPPVAVGPRFEDACLAEAAGLAIPKRAWLPRFAAAAAVLLLAVGSLLSPVLGGEDPGAIAAHRAPATDLFEVDAITFDPGPRLDLACVLPTDTTAPC